MIESVNNKKIIEYAKLNNKKYRDLNSMYIVEGEHLVNEALKKNLVIDAFSLDGSIGTKVSLDVMKKLSSLSSVPNELAILKKEEKNEIIGNVLILDGIQDPGNLGTIIRSAVAFNIETIIALPNTVDVYNTKTLRSSEGMFFNINYLKMTLNEIKEKLKDYQIFTTNVNHGSDISSINKKDRYALIMGNEGNGVSEEVNSIASDSIYIKMNDKCESLNVAIATSIILYELSK